MTDIATGYRMQPAISCVVCAYNEAGKIAAILRALTGHPLISEIIVVNDGSTDATLDELAPFTDIRLITYAQNRGKTYAISRGSPRRQATT